MQLYLLFIPYMFALHQQLQAMSVPVSVQNAMQIHHGVFRPSLNLFSGFPTCDQTLSSPSVLANFLSTGTVKIFESLFSYALYIS